jgi:hypothetical protein
MTRRWAMTLRTVARGWGGACHEVDGAAVGWGVGGGEGAS